MTTQREQQLLDEIERLRAENKLLRQKLDLVLRKLFGKSSEAIDPAQLELLLGGEEPTPGKPPTSPHEDAPEEAASNVVELPRKPRRERMPENLPVVEETLLPESVKSCPDAWRRIGEEKSEQLDYQPGKVFIRRVIRPTFVRKSDPDAVPLTAKLPPRLADGLTATPGLIAHTLVAKYCDHLPFYRQEKIFASRHGVEIGRNTLCRWAALAAFWLKPVYQRIHRDLLGNDYLQVDETPIRYLAPGAGKTKQGYLWTLHRPGGNVFYQWHPGRQHTCLDELLDKKFRGILQSDGYAAYDAFAAKHPRITLAGCWAHARRKFHEALQTGQEQAAGVLKTIGRLYAIEKELRHARAGPEEKTITRQARSAPLLATLHRHLLELRGQPSVLPKSPLGKAIAYTLAQWPKLVVFIDHGQVMIDNNPVENSIRPTAVGKKNWLFVGGEDTGERSAIIYTLIESAKRHGHELGTYLTDVLTRLPGMKTTDDLDILLPANWQSATQETPPVQAAL